MTIYLGDNPIAGLSERTKYNAHHLLDFKWTDCLMNDVSWLRADTFSWQDGSVYVSAYNAIVADLQGATQTTETIASTTITYYRATSGRKIVLADQETNASTIYNATGYGWYYILDTENTRFKFPRNKWGFTGLRDNVGDYVAPGLPNITGEGIWYKGGEGTGAIYTAVTGSYSGTSSGANERYNSFDASRSNPIYGNNTTVQPPAVQMYLYFYIGDFSQTAIEQTAGINSELFNDKADVDLSNLSNGLANTICTTKATTTSTASSGTPAVVVENYLNDTSWYRVYSDGWCEQGGLTTSLATVTLLKAYSALNYTLLALPYTYNSGGGYPGLEINSQTTTQFSLRYRWNSGGTVGSPEILWYTAGYKA